MITKEEALSLLRPVLCDACGGSGREWQGCGCGRGVMHVADCGTRPPSCGSCRGRGHTGPDLPVHHLAAAIVDLHDLVSDGVEAIRLTREYVGLDVLPAVPGWSWYDWTQRALEREST